MRTILILVLAAALSACTLQLPGSYVEEPFFAQDTELTVPGE